MSTATLREKLTFDETRRRAHHLRLAIATRDVARRYAGRPADRAELRAIMREHARHATHPAPR